MTFSFYWSMSTHIHVKKLLLCVLRLFCNIELIFTKMSLIITRDCSVRSYNRKKGLNTTLIYLSHQS